MDWCFTPPFKIISLVIIEAISSEKKISMGRIGSKISSHFKSLTFIINPKELPYMFNDWCFNDCFITVTKNQNSQCN